MVQDTNMTQGKPLRLLLFFALPLMFGNIFQQLYTVVDIAIIGQGVGMDALAALGSVDWLNWMMIGIVQGFTQGFSVRIAQKYGEGDLPEMRRFIAQAAILTAVLSLLYLTLGQLLLPLLLILLRVPAELSPMAEAYTRTLLLGAPAVMFFNYCSSVLRAVGDSKTPLKAMIIASIVNIILDLAAVFGLGLGIAGAGMATNIAQCVAGGICAIKIIQNPLLHFGKKELQKNIAILKNLTAIGSPAAAKNVIISIGGMAVQTIVNGFGTGFIAGYTATSKLYGLLEIAAISYGYAITTYVGQNYGAGKPERIREGVRSAGKLSVATSVVIAGIMFLFGRSITALFISTEIPALAAEAKHVAYCFLCVMSAFLPVLYLLYVYLSALQGMGYTGITLISGIIEFLIRLIIAFIIGLSGFEMGIFCAEIIAWIGAAVYLMIHYYRKIALLDPACH
ncbi:MAG: MATE family efflux transporter [Anaerotignum sp.]|nr:MATE family efflux transporter [Anaerotignum sp.]